MVDAETVRARPRALDHYLERLEGHAAIPRARFVDDADLHDLAERHAHLAVEAMLDIANHVAVEAGWATPESYRHAFTVLAEQGAIESKLASQLAGWAGLGNVLVHLYLAIDHARVHDVLQTKLDGPRKFATALRQWLVTA